MNKKNLMAVFCMVLIVSSSFSVYGYSWLDKIKENDENNLGEIVLINVDKYEPKVITSDYVQSMESPVWIQLSGNTLEGYFFGGSEGETLDTAFGDLKIRSFRIDPASYSKYVRNHVMIPPVGGDYKIDASGNLDLGVMKIYLKRMSKEEKIPDVITLNFSADIVFDYDSGFGVFGRQDLYFDNVKLTESGQKPSLDIWDGKGSLELVSVQGTKANFILRESDGDEIKKFSLGKGDTVSANLKDGPTFLGDRIRIQLKSLGGVEDVAKIVVFGDERDYVEGMNLYTGSDWIVQSINYNSVTLYNEDTREKKKLTLAATEGNEHRIVDCDSESMSIKDGEVVDLFKNDIPGLVDEVPFLENQDKIYCAAVKEYRQALEYLGVGDERDEINYEIANIYGNDRLKDPWHRLEYLKEIPVDSKLYKEKNLDDEIKQVEKELDSSGLGCDAVNGISVCLRDVVSVDEESSVFLKYDFDRDGDLDVKEFKVGDEIVTDGQAEEGLFYYVGKIFKDDKSPTSFKWVVDKIKPGSVVFKKIISGKLDDTILAEVGESAILVYESRDDKPDKKVEVEVVDIDSPLSAVVSILPGDGRNTATSHFSVHLPIEKSAIQWTPEQIDSMIEKTRGTIKKLDSIIDNLSKFIKGMKLTCYSVFSYLSVKNAFFLNNKGRQQAMREYYKVCEEETRGNPDYKVSECLKNKEGEIEKRVVELGEAIDYSENLVKRMNAGDESAYSEVANALGKDQKFIDEYLKNDKAMSAVGVGNAEFIELLKESYLNDGVSSKLENVDELVGRLYNATTEVEKDIILKSFIDEKVTQGPVDEGDIVRGGDKETLEKLRDSYNTNSMNYVASTIVANGAIQVYNYHSQSFVTVTPVNDDNGKQYVLDNRLVYSNGNTLYLGEAPDSDGINSEYAYGVEGSCYTDDNSRLTYFDFEGNRGTFPDAGKANYVRVEYDESKAEQRNYVVYNVGANGKIDFAQGDDKYLFGVKYGVSGIKASDVNYAEIYRNIDKEYQKRSANFGTACNEKEKVPPSATFGGGGSSADCENYMSIGDCELLFNVCDPVMCPASRFNLGGTWKVDDVVQTGFIGSLVLGWGNNVTLPICLTGINAGLENVRSKFMGFEDCLVAARDNGDNVGICHTIRSVYVCEIFWRETTAVFGSLGGISDIIASKVFNQDTGGGEYLNWKNSWSRLSDSVTYFTSVYAQSAFAAYKARNLGEFGTEVCKSAIYGKNPGVGNFIGELLEPSSPYQFTGFFNEEVDTSLEGGRSNYRVYYHIYAGRNERVNYIVYLKGPGKPDMPVTKAQGLFQMKTLGEGDYVDESFTITGAESGYTQMCIRINNDESCGFGRVSSSFASKYLNDMNVEGDLNGKINSDEECSSSNYVPGSSTLPSGLTTSGLLKTCSRYDPDGEEDRWVKIGECSSEGVSCYVDWESVDFQGFVGKEDEIRKDLAERYGEDYSIYVEIEVLAVLNAKLLDLEKAIEDLEGTDEVRQVYKFIDEYRDIIEEAKEIPPALEDAHVGLGKVFVLLGDSIKDGVSGGSQGDGDFIPTYFKVQADMVRDGDPKFIWEDGSWKSSRIYNDYSEYAIESLGNLGFYSGLEETYNYVKNFNFEKKDKFRKLKITCNEMDERNINEGEFSVLDYEAFKEKALSFCGDVNEVSLFEELIIDLKLDSAVDETYEWSDGNWQGINKLFPQDNSYFDEGLQSVLSRIKYFSYLGGHLERVDVEYYKDSIKGYVSFEDDELKSKIFDFGETIDEHYQASSSEVDSFLDLILGVGNDVSEPIQILEETKESLEGEGLTSRSWDCLNSLYEASQEVECSDSSEDLYFWEELAGLKESVYGNELLDEGEKMEVEEKIDEMSTCEVPFFEELASGDDLFSYVEENRVFNGESLKSCECGIYCKDYYEFVEQYSLEYDVDPVLVSALIVQESDCNEDAESNVGSHGLMQIEEGSFNQTCSDMIDSFELIKGGDNVENNIKCGIKIFKAKYNEYKNGVYESWSYLNNNAFKSLVNNCISAYPKYETYRGWDAALRGYNGWGCNENADTDYVEKVNAIYSTLSSVDLDVDESEEVVCSSIEDLTSCYAQEYCIVKEKAWWNFLGKDKCVSCYDVSCGDIGAKVKCDGSCGVIWSCGWSDSDSDCIKKNLISNDFQESEGTSIPVATQKDVISVAEEVIEVAKEEVEENVDEAKDGGIGEAQEKIEDSVEIAEEVVELVESSGCRTETVDTREEDLKKELEELDRKIKESENIAMPEVSIKIEEFSEDVELIDYYVCPPTMISDEEIAQKILETQQKIAESKKKRIEELNRRIRGSENIPMPEIRIIIEDELEEINLDEFIDTVHDLQCLPQISFETRGEAERIIEDIESVSVEEEIMEEILEVTEQPVTCVVDSSSNPLCDANNRDNFVQGQLYDCYPSIGCRGDSNAGQEDCAFGESCCRPACDSMFSNRECVDTDYYECTSDVAKYYCPGDASVVCCERGDQISYSDSVKGRLNSMMSGNRDYIEGDPICTGVNCAGFVRRAFNHAFGEGRHFITGVGGNAWDMPKHVDERDGKIYWFDWRNGEIFTNYDSLRPGDIIGFHYAESDYRPGTELGVGNTEEIDFTHVALYLGEKNGEHYITHLYHVPTSLRNLLDEQKNEAVRVEPIDDFLSLYGNKFSIRVLMKSNPERLYRPVPNYEVEDYVVESGDTIIGVAEDVKRWRDDVEEVAWLIANYNSLVDSTRIFEGVVIEVPLMGEVGE